MEMQNDSAVRIIVAVTAASGAIYARQTLETLIKEDSVSEIGLILSDNAEEVMQSEHETIPTSTKIRRFSNSDLFASPASGSSDWNAMIIVPCTVATVARIASGVSRTLIERSADVMLKERRRLVVVLRETPLSLIHIRNLATITEAGAVVLPAAPSFYSHPGDIEELCSTVTSKAVSMAGIDIPHYHWGE